ncbi:type IV secretion protein IcmK [Coxiella burnetii]|uniref:IcmK n=1 Tax=Coxiella burnetii (strain Dugway 5J108-111) TaxID=434922 RepID=A9KDL9_COXBN|nr:DotH/IcmK family type IV secretion protein [Coxiella burnetii]ABS77467.2 IcmK [Coxiella burnetii Dugway 5J108-111]OYK80844.1 type IV secretion protein IcmK [Coxiella burnetii]OYK82931.1 type IV secretion protein IcmK [Coxiella burnetii]
MSKVRKMVIRKIFLTLLIGASIIPVLALADNAAFAYGVRSLITDPAQNSPSTQPRTADKLRQNQQAVIDNLLNKARSTANPTSQNEASSASSSGQNPGLSDDAFANTIRNMMPLSPDQIRTLHYLFDQSQQAAAAAPGVPPKPTSASVIVNLSPGATPPIIRLSSGFVTSLVFLDSSGAPWPIQAYDLGDPKSFNIQWNKKGNTLLVQALSHYKAGNLAVVLQGLDTPVMLTLMPGQRAVDYRVDLRVPGLGPNANPDLDGLPATESPELLNVLNGVPPSNSKPLTITGGDCQGWLIKGHIFLRTRLTVLSPGWISTMSSADGTHAYELQTTPVVLASQRGQLVKLMIEGL